jgi:hypothetical protein
VLGATSRGETEMLPKFSELDIDFETLSRDSPASRRSHLWFVGQRRRHRAAAKKSPPADNVS